MSGITRASLIKWSPDINHSNTNNLQGTYFKEAVTEPSRKIYIQLTMNDKIRLPP